MTQALTIGDIQVERIVEKEEPFLDARKMFPALDADELGRQRSWLERIDAIVPGSDILTITVQSFLVRTPHHTILVDTCVGNHKETPFRPEWGQQSESTYVDNLARAGVSVADIDFVFCTHLHVDHVGWNTRLSDGRWIPTFPNARYLFGKAEYEHWEARHRQTRNPTFAESVLPVVEAGQANFASPDEVIDDHVRLMPTPGHTPGHQSAILGRDGALITGDLIHSPLQVSRPDLSPYFDLDPVLSAQTRRQVLELMCEKQMICCAVHFPAPSMFRIHHDGSTFRCEAAL